MINGLLDRPEDFEAWVSPQALLQELAPLIGGRHKAAREAHARLKHGLLTAVAGSAHWSDRGRQINSVLVVISPGTWESALRIGDPDQDFWTSGSLVVNTHEPGRSSLARTFFDVRFYPHLVAHIAAIKLARAQPVAAPPILTPPNPRRTQRPTSGLKVSRTDLRAWVKRFGASNPGAPFGVILQNARMHFRQFRVTERPLKDIIAELGMTKSRGNPAIRQK